MAQEKAAETAPVKAIHKFVGASKCKMCHNTAANGEQFKKWTESKHSKAFEVLASEEAVAIGKKLGVDKPQASDKCLGCHLTGYAAPAADKAASYVATEGVGCEACHGAGADYMKMQVMKDKTASIAAGLVLPDEKLCVGCHNDKSPTYKKFVFADAAKLIAHPIPPKK